MPPGRMPPIFAAPHHLIIRHAMAALLFNFSFFIIKTRQKWMLTAWLTGRFRKKLRRRPNAAEVTENGANNADVILS